MTNERLSQTDHRRYGSPADPLSAHRDAYERHLAERGYAAGYIKACKRGIEHLSRCCCASTGRDRRMLRAALGHLLVVLRAAGIIAPDAIDSTPVGEELRRYENSP